MQLGIGSFTYGWGVDISYNESANLKPLNELGLIERAKQFNVHLLQLGDNLPMHEWTEERLKVFEKLLQQNHIVLEIGARGLTEEHLHRYIQLCKRFNSKLLRFVTDGIEWEPTIEEIISIIKNKVSLLHQNNITLALENHDRFKVIEYVEIMNSVNSLQVGICLDTVNSMGAGESVEYIVDTLSPFTVNLHIKDFGIARLPHKQGFIVDGRIAGEGMLDIALVIDKLKKYNRCQTCILEQWTSPEKDNKITIQKELDWAIKSIKNLKQLPQLS